MILAIGCLGYWLWIHKNELKFKYYGSTNNLNLKIVESRSMKNFLAKSNITVNSNDSRYKEVPKSLIEKDGLKIEAIGNLRDKLLSDEFVHSLESFLNRNGCMVMIKSAYYAVDGYVHFQIIQSIKSDRMRF